jgi:hypothetical protein
MVRICHPNWLSQRYWQRIGARLAAAREVSRLAHPNWTDPTWWRNAVQLRQYGPGGERPLPARVPVDVVIDRDHRPRHRVTERFAERRSQSSWVSDLVRAAREARRGG